MRSNLNISGLVFSPEEICHECEKESKMNNWYTIEVKSPRGYVFHYVVRGISLEAATETFLSQQPTWEFVREVEPLENLS